MTVVHNPQTLYSNPLAETSSKTKRRVSGGCLFGRNEMNRVNESTPGTQIDRSIDCVRPCVPACVRVSVRPCVRPACSKPHARGPSVVPASSRASCRRGRGSLSQGAGGGWAVGTRRGGTTKAASCAGTTRRALLHPLRRARRPRWRADRGSTPNSRCCR